MIDHIGLSVSDFEAAKRFYDQALAPLGMSLLAMVPEEFTDGVKVGGYGAEQPVFWLGEGAAQVPPLHVAFAVERRAEVDAFHAAGLAAEGRDNGAPGLRTEYHPGNYAAFVLDPDGNNIEAVCHKPQG